MERQSGWKSLRAGLIFMVMAAFFFCCLPADCLAATDSSPLTQEEQEFVDGLGTLRVGFVQDRTPVSYEDENGQLAGISRDIFDRIAEISGLRFEYVKLPLGDVTYDYLVKNRLDLITSVEYNKENKKARGILISDPYMSSTKVIVGHEDLQVNATAHLKIAVSTGSQTLEKVLKAQYPNSKIIRYDTISDCFDAVDKREADLLIQNQFVAEFWLYKPAYEDLRVIPIAGMTEDLCFSAMTPLENDHARAAAAFARSEKIIGIINKANAQISADEITTIIIENTVEKKYNYTLGDVIYRYRYIIALVAVSLVIIILLIIVSLSFYARTARAKAESKAKGEFLSTMSHEIRTPLNGLIGLNYLMERSLDDKEKMDNYLRQSSTTARYLQALVNDILDMSKLQEHKMELSCSAFSLPLTVQTIDSIERSRIERKGLTFTIDPVIPYPDLFGDETRIQQVMLNILDNAYKFTPAGGKITMNIEQQQKDRHILTKVEIADTGCGMSEEFQEQIFQSFTQERSEVSKGNQGTGLGMSISYLLARQMGGDLTVASKLGQGSCFTFTFAAPAADEQQKKETDPQNDRPAADSRSLRILVAEDNDLNATILVDLLTEEGFDVVRAENGQQALEQFAGSEPGEFSFILMDLLMPEMDGFETAQAIRRLKRPDAKTVKIFACTANSFQEDKDKAIASGMDDFVTKPVDVYALLDKLKRY